jgi:hypothetical protein
MSLMKGILKNSLNRLRFNLTNSIWNSNRLLSDVSFVHRESDFDSKTFEFNEENKKVIISLIIN